MLNERQTALLCGICNSPGIFPQSRGMRHNFSLKQCASRGRWLDLLKIFFKYFRSVQHGRVLSVAPCQIPHCSYPGQTVSVLKM